MNQTLQGIKGHGANITTQALRVFKLKWKEDDIKSLGPRIQSHNIVLQLALEMINVYANFFAPTLLLTNFPQSSQFISAPDSRGQSLAKD
jgi:hypothetical protein